jgi:uncharacterized membrane protein SpoIIM required for sporulation
MDLATFLKQRRADWTRLEELLARAEGSGLGSLEEVQVVELGHLYRRAASDLNQSQTFVRGEGTERYLNGLIARAYVVIHGREPVAWRSLLLRFLASYPAVFRKHLGYFLLSASLFAAGSVFGFVASKYDPETARLYLLPADMPTITPEKEDEANLAPTQTTGEFAAFSSFLFANNLRVSLLAFALGITLGLGSAWLMFYNGVLMGALAAVFAEAGQTLAFATGVLPHGVLEIPAAVLGGAAGFVLADGLLRARPWPRWQQLAKSGLDGLQLVAGCVPLLAAAAVLEAGVARAPDWFQGKGIKLVVAAVVGLLFLAYILVPGWRQGQSGEA